VYEYDRSLFLDTANSKYFRFYWTIDELNGILHAAMVCQQTDPGWCGVGWSLLGSMIGSDAVIGSVFPGNSVIIQDYFLAQQTPPGNGTCPNGVCPDTTNNGTCINDVYNTTGRRVGQYMVLEFSRPVSTSDPVTCDLDIPISDNTQYILCAFGTGYAPNDINRHTDRLANASFDWQPPYTTTSFLTTAGMTTGGLTTGVPPAVPTTGVQVTTGVVPATTGGVQTTGLDLTTADSGTTAEASSGTGQKIFGLAIWIFAIIVAGIALVIILIIVGLAVGISKRKKKKEYFGGFY